MAKVSNQAVSDQALTEITKLVHEHQIELKNDARYVKATVTASITVGFEGANLNGWITYNDQTLGKVEFHSSSITKHDWYYAGGGVAADNFPVLRPELLKNEGGFSADGTVVTGSLMLRSEDGTQAFQAPLGLGGVGAIYWDVAGKVHFSPCN